MDDRQRWKNCMYGVGVVNCIYCIPNLLSLLIFSYLEVVSVSPVCWSKPGVGIISPHMGHFFLLQNARELCPRELCLFVTLFPRMPSHQCSDVAVCWGRVGECRSLWEDWTALLCNKLVFGLVAWSLQCVCRRRSKIKRCVPDQRCSC